MIPMNFNNCTEEFKKIYTKYLKHKSKCKKPAMNNQIYKLLEERNKVILESMNEEDLLHEEAIDELDNILKGKKDDMALHHQLLMQKEKMVERRRKRNQQKQKLENVFEEEVFEDINTYAGRRASKIKSKKTLPPIEYLKSAVATSPNASNSPILFNKGKQNLKRIKILIEENKMMNNRRFSGLGDKMQNPNNVKKVNFILPSTRPNYNPVNTSSTRVNTDQSLLDPVAQLYSLTNLSSDEHSDKNEHIKTIEKNAGKKEVDKVIRIIEKQSRLKKTMNNIETIESRVIKAKENSMKFMKFSEMTKHHLTRKVKKVVETNFQY